MSSTVLGASSLAGMAYVTQRGSTLVSVMPMVGMLAAVISRRACWVVVGESATTSEGLRSKVEGKRPSSSGWIMDDDAEKTLAALETEPGFHLREAKPL